MDKIFSTRNEESIAHRITMLAQRFKISKKFIVESAIEMYAQKLEKENKTDIFQQTFGSWKRNEKASTTVEQTRHAFNKSMKRYQK